jgi:transposase-like protein
LSSTSAIRITPVEVVTDHAPAYPACLGNGARRAWHRTDQYANNRIEADHGRLKARLGPMRGLKQGSSARIVTAGLLEPTTLNELELRPARRAAAVRL